MGFLDELVGDRRVQGKSTKYIVNYFAISKYNIQFKLQVESERNSANRSRNPVTHRGGSKSFQHHREDLVNLSITNLNCYYILYINHTTRKVPLHSNMYQHL